MEVPLTVLAAFRRRADSQIMGLELLSIALALNTFTKLFKNRAVVVHSDNTGSEVGLVRCVFFPPLSI